MKSVKIDMPDRVHRKIKQWVVLSENDVTQADLLIYLFENLASVPMPKLKPDPVLLSALKKPPKGLTVDQRKTLELIGKGVIKAIPDEQKLIDRLLKNNAIDPTK